MSQKQVDQILNLLKQGLGSRKTRQLFKERIGNIRMTRDDGELTHLATFIVPIDVVTKNIFIGHHKKSNLWIPSGGHVDLGELFEEAAIREIKEELGIKIDFHTLGHPELLTITNINNTNQPRCKRHYDSWFFIKVNQDNFFVDQDCVMNEFYSTKWVNLNEARLLATNIPCFLEAIEFINKKYFIK